MAHETVYGFQEKKSALVGGHIMQTLLWDMAKFVGKNIGSGNVTYLKIEMNNKDMRL